MQAETTPIWGYLILFVIALVATGTETRRVMLCTVGATLLLIVMAMVYLVLIARMYVRRGTAQAAIVVTALCLAVAFAAAYAPSILSGVLLIVCTCGSLVSMVCRGIEHAPLMAFLGAIALLWFRWTRRARRRRARRQ